jgi:TolA-binding protein
MASYTKIQKVQEQVDEVVHIAKENVGKLLERDERLTDLQTKTEDLEAQSHIFKRQSTNFKRMF